MERGSEEESGGLEWRMRGERTEKERREVSDDDGGEDIKLVM